MSEIRYTATKLNATGKSGILKPDAQGYYTVPVGGLNSYNSAGQYYPADGARKLFESSSTFMHRISNGYLYGELGHPKKQPGVSENEYVTRLLSVEETNIVCHYAEVWLDESYGKNRPDLKNPQLVAVMAKVKPAGPMAKSLENSFQNPHENVCFSVRAFTRDYQQRGLTLRVLDHIVTWDRPTAPGISMANKWDSPATESHHQSPFGLATTDELVVSRRSLEELAQANPTGLAVEATQSQLRDLLKNTAGDPTISALPRVWVKW